MANRNMQAKRLKMARMRRTYPKWISSGGINSAKAQAYGKLSEKHEKVYGSMDNASRVRTVSGGLPILNNTFMQEIPATKSLSSVRPDPMTGVFIPSPRKLVVEDKRELMSDEFAVEEGRFIIHKITKGRKRRNISFFKVWQDHKAQGVTEYTCIVLKEFDDFMLGVFWAGNEFLFVQEAQGKRWISEAYPGREVAFSRYRASTINWISSEQVQLQEELS